MVGKLKSTFDFAFLQTVFLYRTSVQLKLNPLLSESQTEVELRSAHVLADQHLYLTCTLVFLTRVLYQYLTIMCTIVAKPN